MPLSHQHRFSPLSGYNLSLVFLFTYTFGTSQDDSLHIVPDFLQDQIESLVDNLDSEEDFDFNVLGENLQEYLARPLALNRASQTDLESLQLLTDIQITEFLHYRLTLGELTSIYELQAIPSFDQGTITSILPFITIEDNRALTAATLSKMITTGRNELFVRGTRVLEEQKGYQIREGQAAAYAGSPYQYYIRYRHQFEQKLRYGFTLEKDPGEPFFQGVNKNGFDYSSFHFFIRDPGPHIQAVALGDFAVSLGQGLIMNSGYGGGKSAFVTQIKRGGNTLRPYTSVNESATLRGIAAAFQFRDLHFTFFASRTRQDANLQGDTTDSPGFQSSFSSLQLSGLHRTKSEIEDKDAIRHTLVGGRIDYRRKNLQIAVNALNNHFNHSFDRAFQPYNQFYFRGNSLSNLSTDYSYFYKNINLFGETAISDNGALASLNGMLLGLSRYLDLAVLYRNLSPYYQALQATPFIESSQANNEKGLYVGTQIKINPSFWISIYGDYWTHRWLRFAVDAPSIGNEHLFRVTYYKKRKLEAYLQFRSENKAVNQRIVPEKINGLFYRSRKNLRLHFKHQIHKNLELRNRIEFSQVRTAPQTISRGFLVFQDFIYKSNRLPLSFTSRISYFDTDDYNARIYAYENDILYSFSIPAYFNQGIRYYLNLRCQIRNLTLEIRLEQTWYRNQEVISSGNEQIDGNTKSRIKIQCRYVF